MHSGENNFNSFHLAGIVPVAGQPLDFDFPWDDALIPIGKGYLAVERAVLECAYAGCETIWVVCNEDAQPLIKKRLGDFILDPVFATNSFKRHPGEFKKEIPIFYISIHPKDRFKRDSVAWSLLYGANSAYMVSKKISKWVVPDRYYAAFPWGVYDPSTVRDHRRSISGAGKVVVSYNNYTITDGEYLGFTFDAEDYFHLRDRFKERYSILGKGVQKTTLEELFSLLDITEHERLSIPWYNKIDNWDLYSIYISSEECKGLIPVSDFILKRKKLKRMATEEN
jgi:hypothetical protein